MFRSVFTKTMYEKRWLVLFWSLGVLAMALLMMFFYHSFQDFNQAFQNLPNSLKRLVGDLDSLKTVSGYVGQQVFALRIPLLTLIMGTILFTGLIAGDENEGTLQTLLTQPVTRGKVLAHKYLAGMLIALVICSGAFLGVWIGLLFINENMNLIRLGEAVIGVWLLTMVFASLGFALGAIFGKRGIAGSITGLLAFGFYLLTSFVPNVSSLQTVEKFSPFHYYNNPLITNHGLAVYNILVMLGIVAVLLIVAFWVFKARDIYQR